MRKPRPRARQRPVGSQGNARAGIPTSCLPHAACHCLGPAPPGDLLWQAPAGTRQCCPWKVSAWQQAGTDDRPSWARGWTRPGAGRSRRTWRQECWQEGHSGEKGQDGTPPGIWHLAAPGSGRDGREKGAGGPEVAGAHGRWLRTEAEQLCDFGGAHAGGTGPMADPLGIGDMWASECQAECQAGTWHVQTRARCTLNQAHV